MKKIVLIIVACILMSMSAAAQGTGFNFQGRLNDGTSPANGRYDLQFQLFDAVVGGNSIDSVISRPDTVLINGVFSTTLDFGSAPFLNPNLVFMEISVKPGGSTNAYTILGPRQQLTVVPFAVRAAAATNADALNGITSAGFIKNNGTLVQQQASFNITGSGTMQSLTATVARIGFELTIPLTSKLTVAGTTNLDGMTVTRTSNLTDLSVSGSSGLNTLSVAGKTNLNGNLVVEGSVENRNNLTQNRDKGGSVKAMVYVDQFGTIVRCYNGVTGSSTGDCGGISVGVAGFEGIYFVHFPFVVNDRFITVTPGKSFAVNIVASFLFPTNDPNSVNVYTNITDVSGNGVQSYTNDDFMLIIY